jgi:hypothetical protein
VTANIDRPERWRVGRSVGRTVYQGDELIGVMDTPELAALVVAAVNAELPDECDDPNWDERTRDAPARYGA